ncbi:hypothetical protein HYW53_02585 [Candidatus Giovannonibacteria bacterium]|nr:hypothetical protein [Candidatus Giovannonibacteria bacterium]
MDKKNLKIVASGLIPTDKKEFDIVERKGVGHPDTLCDVIAEKISANYSKFCLERYSTILRHMVDKIALSGGASRVRFGGGEMISPVRMYLNCRFTKSFENETIPYLQIATDSIRSHFGEIIPLLNQDKWLMIVDNTHFSPGPGIVYDKNWETNNERKFFFDVPNKDFAYFHNNSFRSNDTSTIVTYHPLSVLEQLVILIEQTLSGKEFKSLNPWVGTDIKVMGRRNHDHIQLTLAVPFIASKTPSKEFYFEKLLELNQFLIGFVQKKLDSKYQVNIFLNTRDDVNKSDYYLTLTGSAIESGDEGVVGRGNRYNGVIPFTRHMTLEACCGKNPVYHVGKLYTALGSIISKEVHTLTGLENYVFMTSQMGRSLNDPWSVVVEVCGKDISPGTQQLIKAIVEKTLADIPSITLKIVRGDLILY